VEAKQLSNLRMKLANSDCKLESMTVLMLQYCAGLQHCLDTEESDRQELEHLQQQKLSDEVQGVDEYLRNNAADIRLKNCPLDVEVNEDDLLVPQLRQLPIHEESDECASESRTVAAEPQKQQQEEDLEESISLPEMNNNDDDEQSD